ncbi:hypothetical protein XELAEV_18046856mg [Xenopus laevis]|uniref:Uncharacterized protein n=1 Tax=Xenopus laevis TaxID=8355 RepID=A0A974BTR3_XENLA|nr:hypothetical protein XELAEV_18046856mg [Xenopus laevis]
MSGVEIHSHHSLHPPLNHPNTSVRCRAHSHQTSYFYICPLINWAPKGLPEHLTSRPTLKIVANGIEVIYI